MNKILILDGRNLVHNPCCWRNFNDLLQSIYGQNFSKMTINYLNDKDILGEVSGCLEEGVSP
ncbi:MAG: hypothetical protein GKC53_03180 [Neisseriaceae bacterium]|nr:MAG: hypothetical protein GKC53_03180 [Neisseriaceae bacterium]